MAEEYVVLTKKDWEYLTSRGLTKLERKWFAEKAPIKDAVVTFKENANGNLG